MSNMAPMTLVVDQNGKAVPNRLPAQVVLVSPDGTPLKVTQTAADVLMTGYAAHAVGNVAAADTAAVAIAKLEARIAVLEAG